MTCAGTAGTDQARIRLRITGRVQGVGFRWFVREQARRLGLAGWVRNETDGAVMLEAEGPPELVAELRTAVGSGPPGARVDAVTLLPPGDDALPRTFAVDR